MSVNFTPRLKPRRITSEKLSPGSSTFLNSSSISSKMAILLAMLYKKGKRIHMQIYTMNQLLDVLHDRNMDHVNRTESLAKRNAEKKGIWRSSVTRLGSMRRRTGRQLLRLLECLCSGPSERRRLSLCS